MLKYSDHFDWSTNIGELAGGLAGQVRNLEDQRNRVETGPNHPDLKANDIKAIDVRLGPLRMRVQAAEMGADFYHPRHVRAETATPKPGLPRARVGNAGEPLEFRPVVA